MIKIYKKLISYAPEKKYLLVMTIIFSVSSALFQIFSFYYLNKFLLKIISNSEMDYLMNSAVKVVSFMFCGALLYFLSLLVSHLFAFRLETNLRKYGIDGLSKASFKFFDMNSSGVIRKQIDDNAAQTHTAVAHLIPDNIGATLMPFFIIVLGFFISLRVGLIMLFLAIVSCILFTFMVGNKEFMKIYLSAMDKLSSETVEYIRGIQVIKIFGIDVRSFKQLNEAIKNYAQYSLAYAYTCRIPWVLFQEMFLGIVAILIPLIINFTDYKTDSCQTLTELLMIFFLSGVMFSYVYKIMNLSMYLYKAQDSVNKLENLYENMRSNSLVFGNETKFDNYDIEFKNVSFGYTDKIILNNLSFKLQEGKKYALVGSSGSGKSTIVKLISGFYKVNEGTIEIGGKPINDYTEQAIVENIAFVFQNAKLFKTSIFENVKMAKKDAKREDVMQALHLAECDSIISKFQDKENTVIGSKGVYLSGGEKQRIAIARAILKNAKIIIFDEASASIDSENEYELQKAFSQLMKNKTVIMIAHRLTSIKNVDEILVLKEGKIIERGTDKELSKENSLYKYFVDLYNKANDWRISDEKLA